jgi:hypothetical protein
MRPIRTADEWARATRDWADKRPDRRRRQALSIARDIQDAILSESIDDVMGGMTPLFFTPDPPIPDTRCAVLPPSSFDYFGPSQDRRFKALGVCVPP